MSFIYIVSLVYVEEYNTRKGSFVQIDVVTFLTDGIPWYRGQGLQFKAV